MDTKVNLKYSLWIAIVVGLSWFVHELAHWIVASLVLGYKSAITLNTVYLVNAEYESQAHMIWTSAAGPIMTIIITVLAFQFLMKKGWLKMWYPLLIVAVYTRALAGFFNTINLNDEGRISHAFGIGDFSLSIIITAFFGFMLYRVNRVYKPTNSFRWKTLGLIVLYSSILILSDQFFKIVLWVA